MGRYPTIPQRWTRTTLIYSPSLAHSGKTTSRSLRDIWQTDCKPSTASTSFVWLPFSANTITFTYHPLFELFFHRSYLKTTTDLQLCVLFFPYNHTFDITMIRLDLEKEKNKFCFFLKVEDELICFRYSTLIFEFNASLFILNFVLKHHTERFPTDSWTEMLLNNLYADSQC